MYDCPHKKQLAVAQDEIKELEAKNEELNNRLESVDNLIEQGLVDIKGIITELFKGTDKINTEDIEKITSKVERVFNTQKITDIVNDNLRLRKELHHRELKIMELSSEAKIINQENQSLNDDVRLREELDKNQIKEIRNMDKQAEEQLSLINANDLKLRMQDKNLKVLEEFIINSRNTIKGLKEEHLYYLKEFKALKSPNLTKHGKKVLNLIKGVKKLKNKPNGALFKIWGNASKAEYEAKMVFMELKDMYFGLADFEKQKVVEQYDEVARLMGE